MLRKLNNRIRRVLGFGQFPGVDRDGFTLIEILMVLMILTVGVLPIAIIQHHARKEVNESDRYTQGIELAQFHMERAKGLGFGNAVTDSGALGNVQWTLTVTNINFGMDRLEVTTRWNNGDVEETLTIANLVSIR